MIARDAHCPNILTFIEYGHRIYLQNFYSFEESPTKAVPIRDFLKENNDILVPVAKEIPENYTGFVGESTIYSGRLFYEHLCEAADSSRVISLGSVNTLSLDGKEDFNVNMFFASSKSEKYFDITGDFPKEKMK